MTVTSTRVSFGLFALEIKLDSHVSSLSDQQPFSKVADLQSDSATSRPYATYEPDFWLLDGEYKFIPDDYTTVHAGFMSLEMSDENGDFATPPSITVDFGTIHSIPGLALRFQTLSNDYATQVTVAYYDDGASLIRTDDYYPNSPEFSTGQAVDDFKQIVLTFLSTNRPYRYLRLTGIDYGDLISFEGTDVLEASVVEECDPLSAEIRINTLDLTLFSSDADFSIINPAGDYASLVERQPLAVYEIIGGTAVYIGTFYLDEWENESDTVSIFHAVDILGVIDRLTYKGGIWLAGIDLEDLLEDILAPIYVPYELDNSLIGTVIKGWLPICTYREALQQIGFAAGAAVDCSRNGAVKIYATRIASSESAVGSVTTAQKGIKQKLALRSLVTGVDVLAHNFVADTETQNLYDATLDAGEHEIAFPGPMHDLTPTGATIVESGVNYALLSVAAPGAVTLTGEPYLDTVKLYQAEMPDLPTGVRPNVLKIEDATLVNNDNGAATAQRVYDYYAQRYRQEMKLFAPSIEVGQVILVDTLYEKQIRGVVEKMESDLGRGFQSNVETVGVAL